MTTEQLSNIQTPFYHYDLSLLRRTVESIRKATAEDVNFHVHYAVKACVAPEVLSTISSMGLGADCVSGGEIERAAECGFKPANIVYAGVGKADWEIEKALELGIEMFNVESLEEL